MLTHAKIPQRLTNSAKITLTAIGLLAIMLFFNGCKECNRPAFCGCALESQQTIPGDHIPGIPAEEQKGGKLFFKRSEHRDEYVNDEPYNNRFWIFQGGGGNCYNCERRFIVCNDDVLGAEYDYLKRANDSIDVAFTGLLKPLCKGNGAFPLFPSYYYAEIVLTSIQPQE